MVQHHTRVKASMGRIGIGEVLTNIPEPSGPEECVHDGVGHDIGVTVTVETRRIGNGDESEAKLARGVTTEAVNIKALPNPHERTSR
jgi:hypothetical protein